MTENRWRSPFGIGAALVIAFSLLLLAGDARPGEVLDDGHATGIKAIQGRTVFTATGDAFVARYDGAGWHLRAELALPPGLPSVNLQAIAGRNGTSVVRDGAGTIWRGEEGAGWIELPAPPGGYSTGALIAGATLWAPTLSGRPAFRVTAGGFEPWGPALNLPVSASQVSDVQAFGGAPGHFLLRTTTGNWYSGSPAGWAQVATIGAPAFWSGDRVWWMDGTCFRMVPGMGWEEVPEMDTPCGGGVICADAVTGAGSRPDYTLAVSWMSDAGVYWAAPGSSGRSEAWVQLPPVGTGPAAVDALSWGRVKAVYR